MLANPLSGRLERDGDFLLSQAKPTYLASRKQRTGGGERFVKIKSGVTLCVLLACLFGEPLPIQAAAAPARKAAASPGALYKQYIYCSVAFEIISADKDNNRKVSDDFSDAAELYDEKATTIGKSLGKTHNQLERDFKAAEDILVDDSGVWRNTVDSCRASARSFGFHLPAGPKG